MAVTIILTQQKCLRFPRSIVRLCGNPFEGPKTGALQHPLTFCQTRPYCPLFTLAKAQNAERMTHDPSVHSHP